MKQRNRNRNRWDLSPEQRRQSEERSKSMTAEELRTQWTKFLSHPSVTHSLNLRVEITLKQRRNSELETSRPSAENIVKVQQRRFALKDAPLFAPFFYLTEDEARRIAVRIMNRLNKELFGNRARRSQKPERLTAVICQHDKDTRRHLHCLFAIPPNISRATFLLAFYRALGSEPFVYRCQHMEPVENLPASILYNINERKSLTRQPIVYLHPQLSNPSDKETGAHQ